jgi:hypothetical protein
MHFVANNTPVTRASKGKTKAYKALEKGTENKIKKLAATSFEYMQEGVDLDGVIAGIEAGSGDVAYAATNVATRSASLEAMTPVIEEAYIASANIAITEIAVPGGFVFNPAAPHIRHVINEQVATRITRVTNATELAVRNIVTDAVSTGRHPLAAAKQIKGGIGLTPRQTKAAERLRQTLIEKGIKGDKLEARIARYQKKQLKLRSQMIARTETSQALNGGRQELWEQLQNGGALPETQEIKWVTAEDERVCEQCGPMDGTIVGLREDFSLTIDRPVAGETTYTAPHPPLHPSCRCSVVLV